MNKELKNQIDPQITESKFIRGSRTAGISNSALLVAAKYYIRLALITWQCL